jgi:predicted hotdog family 3-hydroxylacyl-ACP dehydratase
MLPVTNVETLIPQRPPFVMVGRLLHADETKATSSFTVLKSNILVNDNEFSEAGIIENIAQTAALHMGYVASTIDKKIPQGMIGGIKNLEIAYLPEVNNLLTTSISIEHEVMNAKIIKGTVSMKNEIIARCEMKVFIFD